MSEILFVSRANMGISRLLEGLLRHAAPHLTAHSAGINIDDDDRGLNEDVREVLAEVGAHCYGDPEQLTPSRADRADVVIVIGDTDVSNSIAPDTKIERWSYEDPRDQGIVGKQRYRKLRQDFVPRIEKLVRQLSSKA